MLQTTGEERRGGEQQALGRHGQEGVNLSKTLK